MNRSPTPGGVFATNFVVDVECLRSVRHVIGRSLAAVGADLSRPHIRKHTRNGGRICVFGNPNMCNWQC
ncbi:hypothetical protein [Prevotella pallens]|uniref:hypothetical protein n=1 Tax=Prevotella pallens TaxID=60133 RepID=UPI001CAE8441|nr:hypothetical protein [Prevotella pallens]MBF1463378.1 hypothetical protein [Prevotella pallens]